MLRWCRWDVANCRQNHSLGIYPHLSPAPEVGGWFGRACGIAEAIPSYETPNTIHSAITHENPQLAACFTDRQDMYFLPVAKSISRITIDLRAEHQAPDHRLRVLSEERICKLGFMDPATSQLSSPLVSPISAHRFAAVMPTARASWKWRKATYLFSKRIFRK